MQHRLIKRSVVELAPALLVVLLVLAACGSSGSAGGATPTPQSSSTRAVSQGVTPGATSTTFPAQVDTCPRLIGYPKTGTFCYTPHQLRVAYGAESLYEHGFTGKGQTVVDIVSYGSPTLQQDMQVFDAQFHLPPLNLQIFAPLGTVPFNPHDPAMLGWAGETSLDVQIIHAIAPDAAIVVLTSPVDETEGTIGLPQFLQLEQYALNHQLGNVVSQSWVASEVTLNDSAGQQEIAQWDAFLKQATTRGGMTFFSGSGDNGATDYADLQATKLSPVATTNFAPDDPWVTAVGGTSLLRQGNNTSEVAWNLSGGGFSQFFTTPDFQKMLPPSVQTLLKGRRGVPDVAADADPLTGLVFYGAGIWSLAGGTSASTPLWAGLMAIADQMAGKGLGFINAALYKLAMSGRYTADFHDITQGNNSVRAWRERAGLCRHDGLGPDYRPRLTRCRKFVARPCGGAEIGETSSCSSS
ncbi:MAG TPA: S53 family peptidase [Ktedonobacteraceae bacterium]|nr:S53 family peptidase [Ktedonobacteraceae bacterium]